MVLPVSLLAIGVLSSLLACQAATVTLPLNQLGVEDTLYLPGQHPQRDLVFERPRHWAVAGGTLDLQFNHSSQLSDGSWLQVILNDKMLKHIPLTPANVSTGKLSVPLPPGLMQDVNHLILRTEQHYGQHCEDPTNPSLWTNISATGSRLSFQYGLRPTPLTLQRFPEPLVSRSVLERTPIRLILPANASAQLVQAAARLNLALAQTRPLQTLPVRIQTDQTALPNAIEHYIVLGPAQRFQGSARALAAKLPRGKHIGLFPQANHTTLLALSGDTDEQVAHSVNYLIHQGLQGNLAGAQVSVPAGWKAPSGGGKGVALIHTQQKTLADLGVDNQTVRFMTAPPLTLSLPVATAFGEKGGSLAFHLRYSYSDHLNPLFSSLEVRLNDYPVGSIPLDNPKGGQDAKATVTLPADLLRPDSRVVVQFHLMPDKQGVCTPQFKDTAWARLSSASSIQPMGAVAPRLPDLSLLRIGYPYLQQAQLSDTRIVLSRLDAPSLQALMAVTSRLGRLRGPSSPISGGSSLEVALGAPGLNSKKHLIWIDTSPTLQALSKELALLQEPFGTALKTTWKAPDTQTQLTSSLSAAKPALEQVLLPGGNSVTRLSSPTPQGMAQLVRYWGQDAQFSQLPVGAVARLNGQGHLVALQTPETQASGATASSGSSGSWLSWSGWRWLIYGAGLLLLVLGLGPVLMRLLSRPR